LLTEYRPWLSRKKAVISSKSWQAIIKIG